MYFGGKDVFEVMRIQKGGMFGKGVKKKISVPST